MRRCLASSFCHKWHVIQDRFHYLWQNFHVSNVSNDNNDKNTSEQDENNNLVDDFFGNVGYKDDENDGMEEDAEWAADEIPDWATEAFTETKDVGETMNIYPAMQRSRLGSTKLSIFLTT